MNEKVQTLADLIRADPSGITTYGSNIYYYHKRSYWVVTEDEKSGKNTLGWRWIGQLGNIHVYRRIDEAGN